MPEAIVSASSTGEDKWREIWRICEEARQLDPADRVRYLSVDGLYSIYLIRCPSNEIRCQSPERLEAGSNPSWFPDGKSIYFNTPDWEIWRLALSGGAPKSIGSFGRDPVVSSGGKWLYYRRARNGLDLTRVPLDANGMPSGPEEGLVDRMKSANREHWTVVGDEVIYWDNDTDSKFSGLRAYHTVTRRSRIIAETPAMYPSASPDGATILFSKRDRTGVNVVVTDLGH